MNFPSPGAQIGHQIPGQDSPAFVIVGLEGWKSTLCRPLQFSLYVTEVRKLLQSPQDHQSSELWDNHDFQILLYLKLGYLVPSLNTGISFRRY